MVTPQRVGHGARTPKRRMNGQGLTRIANPGFGARLVASIRLDSRRSWPRTWRFFPAYRPPPDWAEPLVKVFRDHRKDIDSEVTTADAKEVRRRGRTRVPGRARQAETGQTGIGARGQVPPDPRREARSPPPARLPTAAPK